MLDPLPQSLTQVIGAAQWHPVTTGESGAKVYQLDNDRETRYLKVSLPGSPYPVLHEAERLRWLQGRVPVARVLHTAEDARGQYLLTSALPGLMPYHDTLDWSAEARIHFMADAMRQFHSLPADSCPFHTSREAQIATAQHRLEQGRVNTFLLEKDYGGRSAQAMFAELLEQLPARDEELVVGHGDLYPVNVLADPTTRQLTGFLDVGATGVMDRYTDLARTANAILWHYGEDWLLPFFQRYGINQPDWDKLRFYRLLSAFC